MYVDETGGTEDVTTSEEVTVSVDGQDYDVETSVDLDGDGQEDTALVHNDDGTISAYTDTDADGQADTYHELTSDYEVVDTAEYDEESGQWVSSDPTDPGSGGDDQQTGADGPMTAELPGGEVEVGPPTVDTDGDGEPDTAVVEDPETGDTYYFTDTDADGDADQVIIVSPNGDVEAYEHTGDGNWVPIEGEVEDPGATIMGEVDKVSKPVSKVSGWGSLSGEPVEGVAKIDAATGQWVTQN